MHVVTPSCLIEGECMIRRNLTPKFGIPKGVNSIGTCSKCGYHGPGPNHECKQIESLRSTISTVMCPICGEEVEVSSDGFILDHRRLQRGWGRNEKLIRIPVDIYFDCVGHDAFVELAR